MDDLRVPIGSFFVILGVMLLIAFTTISTAPPLSSPDVNLYCGVVALVFGGFMLFMARRRKT
jgi:uncharacterized membrane protein HdeD (DUF308 family)